MQRYVAFLRAINTTGRYAKMESIRHALEPLGLKNLATVIASGNVIFDSADRQPVLVAEIESALLSGLGFEVPVFLRTAAEVAKVADCQIFSSDAQVEVSFLLRRPEPGAARALESTATGSDRLVVVDRELYWSHVGPRSDSPHNEARVTSVLGMPTTQRSLRTVRRIAEAVVR